MPPVYPGTYHRDTTVGLGTYYVYPAKCLLCVQLKRAPSPPPQSPGSETGPQCDSLILLPLSFKPEN